MPKTEFPITSDKLGTQIARAVLIAPDINPKTKQQYTEEVIFTFRPGWSNVNKYYPALPGGKIEAKKNDFEGILSMEELKDPQFLITLDQMIQAGLNAAEREILEELGVTLATGLLHFVDVSTNKSGWTTYSYRGELPKKPTLLVKPESAGTRWVSTDRLVQGNPRLLPGHLAIARRALKGREQKG